MTGGNMKILEITLLMLTAGLTVQAQQSTSGNKGGHGKLFTGERAVKSYKQTINAPPDSVFPLLCPIREADWAAGWVGKVIYAASGYAEEDGVYATEHGEKDDTIWVITKRDSSTHEIEFVYFVPGHRVVRLTISVKGIDHNKSNVYIKYINTGLSEEGNKEIVHQFADANFNQRMAEWERAMNYFLETGKVLQDVR
jgi:hypothetical protein